MNSRTKIQQSKGFDRVTSFVAGQHPTTKSEVTDRIFKFTLIHASVICQQWRIKNFPGREAPIPEFGLKTYYLQDFCQFKLRENERNWTEGACIPSHPSPPHHTPLDPPTIRFVNSIKGRLHLRKTPLWIFLITWFLPETEPEVIISQCAGFSFVYQWLLTYFSSHHKMYLCWKTRVDF